MYPEDLLYTKEHEWVLVQGKTGTIGISFYAQKELGDIVFIELPDIGETLKAGESFGSVESVKAVSEIYAPISGKVLEVNENLAEKPEIINEDPYKEGWMVKVNIADPEELEDLMTAEEYEAFIQEGAGE